MLVICWLYHVISGTNHLQLLFTILAPSESWMRHVGEGPSQPAFALRPNYKKPSKNRGSASGFS